MTLGIKLKDTLKRFKYDFVCLFLSNIFHAWKRLSRWRSVFNLCSAFMAIKQRVIWRALSPVMQINLRRININIRKSLYLKSKSYKSLKEERQTDRQTDRQMLICKSYFFISICIIYFKWIIFLLVSQNIPSAKHDLMSSWKGTNMYEWL